MATKEELTGIRRENVDALIKERFDGRQARFAAAIKKPANYVWRLLTTGPHAKGIGEEIARHIEDRLGLEPYALDKGHGPQRAEHTLSPAPASAGAPRSLSVVQPSAIESIHAKPSAGWVRRHAVAELFVGSEYSNDAFALPVPDASMVPNYLPGEMLVFDPEVKAEAGDYVLARVGAQVLFRRYRETQGARSCSTR